ncbi:unnamed protein product, partial [Meganyctiphanes norvegica]
VDSKAYARLDATYPQNYLFEMDVEEGFPRQETYNRPPIQTSEVQYDIESKYPYLENSEPCFKEELLPSAEIKSTESEIGYMCSYCEYKNCDIFQLQKHIFGHEEYPGLTCFVCGKVFASKRSLHVHLFTHTGEKPFSCTECDFKCTTKSTLQVHARTHTNEKPFLCDICGYRSAHKGYIGVHKKIVHMGIKSFNCTQCDNIFSQSGHLQKHVSSVHLGEKPYSCGECDFTCLSKNDLKRHMSKHSGTKDCICQICGFRAADKKYVANHMKRIHSSEKHLCSECGNYFATKGGLQRHMLIHSDEKPFSCPKCAYKCRQSGSLKTHMMTHMGEVMISSKNPADRQTLLPLLPSTRIMPSNDNDKRNRMLSCDMCDHDCSSEYELEAHRLIHESNDYLGSLSSEFSSKNNDVTELNNTVQSNDKPHKCSFCDYACKQKQSLKRHVILKHHNELYSAVP